MNKPLRFFTYPCHHDVYTNLRGLGHNREVTTKQDCFVPSHCSSMARRKGSRPTYMSRPPASDTGTCKDRTLTCCTTHWADPPHQQRRTPVKLTKSEEGESCGKFIIDTTDRGGCCGCCCEYVVHAPSYCSVSYLMKSPTDMWSFPKRYMRSSCLPCG